LASWVPILETRDNFFVYLVTLEDGREALALSRGIPESTGRTVYIPAIRVADFVSGGTEGMFSKPFMDFLVPEEVSSLRPLLTL
jgi:hypothetical protein